MKIRPLEDLEDVVWDAPEYSIRCFSLMSTSRFMVLDIYLLFLITVQSILGILCLRGGSSAIILRVSHCIPILIRQNVLF